jgi:hypothetical protein
MTIKAGDIVVFKPEWMEKGDENIVFIAHEDEDGGTVEVEAQVDLPFKPLQIVSVSMIEGH